MTTIALNKPSSSNHPALPGTSAIPAKHNALLGLRFIASILIVLDHFHYTFWTVSPLPNFVFAVSFFFMLSGFGLTYAYKGKAAPATLLFVLKRFFRLWPLHVMTLIITALTLPNVTKTTWKLAEAPWILTANALLVHGWIPIRAWFFSFNIGSWSMSMLLACYLFFPVALKAIRSVWRWPLCLALLGFLALMITLSIPCPTYTETRNSQQGLLYISPLSRGLEFFIGMLGASLLMSPRFTAWKKYLSQQKTWVATLLEISVLLLLSVVVGIEQNPAFFHAEHSWLQPLGYYLSFAGLTMLPCLLLLIVFSQERGYLSRFFGSRLMTTLGGLTFGIYLLHLPMLHLYLYPVALKPNIPQPSGLMVFLYFALLLGLSALSAQYFEKPLYRWASKKLNRFYG